MNKSNTTRVTLDSIRQALPQPVKSAFRPAWRLSRNLAFRMRYGFPLPPQGTDLVGYEALIEFFRSRRLEGVAGDVAEIGAFRGGGTYKLAKFLQKRAPDKKMYTIDCFDIQVDQTQNLDGKSMAELYKANLEGQNQRHIFDRVTAGIPNIVVIAGDSKAVELPFKKLCFGFVDGNHSDEYVVSDFYLVWKKLSPGGVISFHDYDYDLPNVTAKINQLCKRHSSEITDIHVDDQRHVIYIQKSWRPL